MEVFEVSHTDAELRKLACFLEKLPGETRIVMEHTGSYWQPIAKVLHDAGLFVSAVNALLIYKYGSNSIRNGKTDKLDAVKIANYCSKSCPPSMAQKRCLGKTSGNSD